MALQVASLKAVLELENRKFNKGIKGAGKSLDSASKALKQFSEDAAESSKGLQKFGDRGKQAFDGIDIGATNAKGSVAGFLTSLNPAGIALGAFAAVGAAITAVGAAALNAAVQHDDAMNQIEARTGETGKELQVLGDVVTEVYRDNWGESMADAADAVIAVNQVLEQTGDAAAQSAKSALIFRDVFGIDIQESVRGVRSAVQSFGIESQTVFDMMARVIQNVGDPAGDLADTVNEYSIIFAQAGFSAEEMFGILQRGVQEGARNFDQVADAVKEFVIRIQDGSDQTREAIARAFGGRAFDEAVSDLAAVEAALERNEAGLKAVQEEWDSAQKRVKHFNDRIKEAQRRIDEFSRPKLKGMEEFDDKLFDLEQQAKKAQLAIIGLEPDSDAFKQGEARLDQINDQIDRLELQRDIKFEPQLRALEKAAKDGREEVLTFGEAMAGIADQKDLIKSLQGDVELAAQDWNEAARNLELYNNSNRILNELLLETQTRFNDAFAGADELLAGLSTGEVSARDAMSKIINALKQVDDQIAQNEIGVALFGTKWEDLGPKVILALDPAVNALEDFEGATNAAGDAASEGLGAAWSTLLRELQTALLPIGQLLLETVLPALQEFATKAGPIVDTFVEQFAALGPVFTEAGESLRKIEEALGLTDGALDPVNLALGALHLGLSAIITISVQVTDAINKIADSIIWVSDKVKIASDTFKGWGDKLSALDDNLPDWLKPGSPTPFEIGIRGISDSLQGLQSAGGLIAAGQTSGNLTLNMGGQAFNFANDANGQDQAMMTILRMLRAQLEQG